MTPALTQVTYDGVTFLTDATLFMQTGIRVAFSLRRGGVSEPPYASLNLGAHVGDDPGRVHSNRQRLCRALRLPEEGCGCINSAGQVHGVHVAEAMPFAHEFPETDALVTDREYVPLLLCFADCVPIIVVDPRTRAVGVIHSGWRGTLDRIAGNVVTKLQQIYAARPTDMYAYIGPYIGLQNFTIAHKIAAQFLAGFDTVDKSVICNAKEGSANLDLGAAITETLVKKGVPDCNIINLRIDTVSRVNDFFSYRAEDRITGRHGALACICSSP